MSSVDNGLIPVHRELLPEKFLTAKEAGFIPVHRQPFDRFASEKELLEAVIETLPNDVYPRVSVIGGKRINPDIDILQIVKISGETRLIGYEIKLIKYDSKRRRISWDALYKGIGEGLLYLRNGVQVVALILGFDKSITDENVADNFDKQLWEDRTLLQEILGEYMGIAIFHYKKKTIRLIVEPIKLFETQNVNTIFFHDALLRGAFTPDKKLLKELVDSGKKFLSAIVDDRDDIIFHKNG